MRPVFVLPLLMACSSGVWVEELRADAGARADAGQPEPVDASMPFRDAGVFAADSGWASDSGTANDSGTVKDSGVANAGHLDAGAVVDAGPPVDLCPAAEATCVAHDRRRVCTATAQGLRWQLETCASGSGCVAGQCVVGACSDECNLGETDGGLTCGLFELATQGWPGLDAGASLHDRARDYNRWLRRDGMAAGGVGTVRYADPGTWAQPEFIDGIGDSALWTGTYLAAEALRLSSTGSPDARANVRRLAGTLHLWLSVSGSPGNLARFAIESAKTQPFVIGDRDCTSARVHCGVSYGGAQYDYVGHVSRDQYQGVVLGLALAYEALGADDTTVKDVIRADVVTLVKELMKERQVQLSIKLNGTRLPTTSVSARFLVLNPAEQVNGALDLQLDLAGGDAEMWGFQEFMPDLADLVREVPGLGWVPPIERPSSAIMLASFFQVALQMTQADPRFAADHADILGYYTGHLGKGGNITQWLAVAKKWAAGSGCNKSYYSNNITFEPLYNLARYESDPVRRADVQNTLFTGKLWPTFASAKNPFFSFIYAGSVPNVSAQVAATALMQLSQFPPAPRVHRAVDLRNDARYPHDLVCPDQASHLGAVDVGDRVTGDFMWQRDPWRLYDVGEAGRVEPGVDYLVAYWLGRRHGFIVDDSAGRCLVFH